MSELFWKNNRKKSALALRMLCAAVSTMALVSAFDSKAMAAEEEPSILSAITSDLKELVGLEPASVETQVSSGPITTHAPKEREDKSVYVAGSTVDITIPWVPKDLYTKPAKESGAAEHKVIDNAPANPENVVVPPPSLKNEEDLKRRAPKEQPKAPPYIARPVSPEETTDKSGEFVPLKSQKAIVPAPADKAMPAVLGAPEQNAVGEAVMLPKSKGVGIVPEPKLPVAPSPSSPPPAAMPMVTQPNILKPNVTQPEATKPIVTKPGWSGLMEGGANSATPLVVEGAKDKTGLQVDVNKTDDALVPGELGHGAPEREIDQKRIKALENQVEMEERATPEFEGNTMQILQSDSINGQQEEEKKIESFEKKVDDFIKTIETEKENQQQPSDQKQDGNTSEASKTDMVIPINPVVAPEAQEQHKKPIMKITKEEIEAARQRRKAKRQEALKQMDQEQAGQESSTQESNQPEDAKAVNEDAGSEAQSEVLKETQSEASDSAASNTSNSSSSGMVNKNVYRLFFEEGIDTVEGENENRIQEIIEKAKAMGQDVNYRVVGFSTEKEDDDMYARRVSFQRAVSVRNFLMKNGIAEKHISVQALGNITSNYPATLKNRVDVYVSPVKP